MRFCLSLTLHYLILHLTGSASFADDPFYKCFSKSFFGLETETFECIYLKEPVTWVHIRMLDMSFVLFARCKYKFAVFAALFTDAHEAYENIC